ncbi:MAG: gliding motility-associated ABC transporter ATP-binding subunit GldA [Cyclobacteriaceae bacterium]|nr:gliding motility-associated ABC transporter ATP-binding subunit GldA [Cyclobacteriaceae bacterium]
MSILVDQLTKLFGSQKAIDTISFELNENEIVGFLGPNGAGKSTTMKIATTYTKPTSGTVLINGMDVQEQPLEVRKIIGYLPEHNPLYLDMYVHEYLNFSGRFYGLGKKELKSRTAEVIDMCQLGIEQNKQIGQLSKGYRQRVGLAQALLHDPSVLILDEPTTGLDPNQIVEVRELIKTVSKGKTVLFSTHIMQEVQAVCDRAIVINKGRIVADGSIDELQNLNANQVIEVEFCNKVSDALLKSFEGMIALRNIGANRYQIEVSNKEDVRPAFMKFVTDNQLDLIGITQVQRSMEDVFATLTQSANA